MTLLSRVEFYKRGGGIVTACRATIVPRQGEFVNIDGKQWKVFCVAWAVDILPSGTKDLRANVELEETN